MSEQRTEAEPIELVYRPTKRDLREAMRARDRVTGVRRYALGGALATWAMTAALILAAVIFDYPAVLVPIIGGVGGALFVLVPWALRGIHLRAMYQALEPEGEVRTVADNGGLRCESRASTVTFTWGSYTEYVETIDQFVLLGGLLGADCVAVLPKRGLRAGEDVDRLRRLLDGKLRCADSPRSPDH
ncbi:hypothetical protein GCM10009799_14960 [Nocardiopsis rhodophaea]|uniref:YcxB-like protein domain-containing protein n=1 Tax=Nocardiopsis rhodophaea TaxID=280238 RepID=A0ABN2SP26_9ACTN